MHNLLESLENFKNMFASLYLEGIASVMPCLKIEAFVLPLLMSMRAQLVSSLKGWIGQLLIGLP